MNAVNNIGKSGPPQVATPRDAEAAVNTSEIIGNKREIARQEMQAAEEQERARLEGRYDKAQEQLRR